MRTFTTRFRARYCETDAAEVLYYGSFMKYFEVGKMEMYRELGLKYTRDFPIVEAFCKYLAPAHFDELLEVRSRFEEIRERNLRVASEVYRVEPDGSFTKVAEGYTTHVHVDKDGKAARLPDPFHEVMKLGLIKKT
ncbi:MAG: thioesterase family protein [Planctomycetota bacterium]